MRDREFVNRFCAFQLLDLKRYRGDMDDFLAAGLRRMNDLEESDLSRLSCGFRRSMANNFRLFEGQAFRKHAPGQTRRGVLNASLWDVMSTGLSRYSEDQVLTQADPLRRAVYRLLDDEKFNTAITYGPNDARKVKFRIRVVTEAFREILGAHAD